MTTLCAHDKAHASSQTHTYTPHKHTKAYLWVATGISSYILKHEVQTIPPPQTLPVCVRQTVITSFFNICEMWDIFMN